MSCIEYAHIWESLLVNAPFGHMEHSKSCTQVSVFPFSGIKKILFRKFLKIFNKKFQFEKYGIKNVIFQL